MARSDDERLREMLDRAEIRELLLRYAHGVDRRNLTLVGSCFTSDATYDGTLGHGTIAAALAALRERMTRYESTLHLIGNQFIELRGDEASSETYTVAYHRFRGADGPSVLSVAVRYLDLVVRDDGEWRIRARTVQPEWQRYDEVFDPAQGAYGPEG
mgnify:CR=1 FL=1